MKKIWVFLVLFLPLPAFANVTFYGQCNYKGPSVELGVGEYGAARSWWKALAVSKPMHLVQAV